MKRIIPAGVYIIKIGSAGNIINHQLPSWEHLELTYLLPVIPAGTFESMISLFLQVGYGSLEGKPGQPVSLRMAHHAKKKERCLAPKGDVLLERSLGPMGGL